MKILVADDDLISGRSLEQTIKEWGYDATSSKNGEEAWQRRNPPSSFGLDNAPNGWS